MTIGIIFPAPAFAHVRADDPVRSRTIPTPASPAPAYIALTDAGPLVLELDAARRITRLYKGAIEDRFHYEFPDGPLARHEVLVAGEVVFAETLTRAPARDDARAGTTDLIPLPTTQGAPGVDRLGRLTSKVQTISGVTDTYAYTYDTAGRRVGGRRLTGGPRPAALCDDRAHGTHIEK